MNILGFDYKTIVVDDPLGMNNWGEHSARHQVLRLNKNLHEDSKLVAILHEVIHAINDRLNTGLNEDNVTRLGVGLYQALKNAGVDLLPLLKEFKEQENG